MFIHSWAGSLVHSSVRVFRVPTTLNPPKSTVRDSQPNRFGAGFPPESVNESWGFQWTNRFGGKPSEHEPSMSTCERATACLLKSQRLSNRKALKSPNVGIGFRSPGPLPQSMVLALSTLPPQAVEDLETREVGTYDDRILSLVDDLMLEAGPLLFLSPSLFGFRMVEGLGFRV